MAADPTSAEGGLRTTVFFRDDDVKQLTDALRGVVELLVRQRVPANYELIPMDFTADAAAYLKEQRASAPGLLRLNQHGYRHEQRIGGEHRWSEFAGRRPYAEQLADIRAGRERLREMLGDDFDGEVFTPPCHKYDAATVRALRESGFGILSASVFSSPGARLFYGLGRRLGRVHLLGRAVSYHGRPPAAQGLREVSVSIDVDCETDERGEPRRKTLAELQAEFRLQRAHHRVVGVMLHHHHYTESSKLDCLEAFVDWLKRDSTVSFETIEQIAARPEYSRTDA